MKFKINIKKIFFVSALIFVGFNIASEFNIIDAYVPPTAARMEWRYPYQNWETGSGVTGQNFKVTKQIDFQCFQNMSYPPGWLDCAHFELWWPNNSYTHWYRPCGADWTWQQSLSVPGQYHFKCSQSGSNAEDQYFTIYPNTLGCNQACSPYSGPSCASGTSCFLSNASPYVGYYCRGNANPYSASCASQSICNEQCTYGVAKNNPQSCTGPVGNNDCYYDSSVGYRCRSSFNYSSTSCPVCTPIKPNNSVTQVVPTNGQTGVQPYGGGYVTLQWYDTAPTWGQGCPTTLPSYHLYVSKACTGTYTDFGSTTLMSGALMGTKYCWFVRKDNGSASQDTAVWNFTTAFCTPTNPAAAILNSPNDNQTVSLGTGGSVPVVYDASSMAWGTGCPANNNTATIMVQTNCTGAWTPKGSGTTITGLVANTTYCWRVDRSNGSNTTQSAVRRFTTIDDGSNVGSGSGITTADICGAGYSGALGEAKAVNPIDFNLNFTTATGNQYREVWLAMVPTAGAYADNSDTDIDSFINGKVAGSQSIAVKIDLINNRIHTVNGSGVWDGGVPSGDITNSANTVTVKGFGTTTVANVAGLNLTSTFRLQFNNSFPYGLPNNDKYNFYVAVVIRNSIGEIKSSYSTPVNSFMYKKINATASRPSWGVDVKKPSVTMTGPTFTGATTFNIGWSATDGNPAPLTYSSYISTDTTGAGLNDSGGPGGAQGAVSLIAAPPDPAPPTASNGKITASTIGSRTYTITTPSIQAGYGFRLYAFDGACNQGTSNVAAANQKPWLAAYNGDISANGGIAGISVPNIPNYQMPFTSDNNAGFLSTYSALSGNVDLPTRKQSKLQEYSTKLQNTGALPPQDSGFANWYDFILDNVQENAVTPFVPQPTTLTADKTISSWLGLTSPPTGGGSGPTSGPCAQTTVAACTATPNGSWCSNVGRCFPLDQGPTVNCVAGQSNSAINARIDTACGIGGTGGSATSPKLVGRLSNLQQTDSTLTVNGSYAYTAGSSTTMSYIDISNKTAPKLYLQMGVGVASYSMSSQGNYLYNVAPSTTKMQVIYTVYNPTLGTPKFVATPTVSNIGAASVKVVGNYAYVMDTYSQSLKIFNVTTPESPSQVGQITTGCNPQVAVISGNYAYIGNNNGCANDFKIINIANPSAPVEVGNLGAGSTGKNMTWLAVDGNRAYGSDPFNKKVYIIDITNKNAPSVVGTISPGSLVGSMSKVAASGNYLFLASQTHGLLIYDVSNPGNPKLVINYNSGGVNDLYIDNGYLYLLTYGELLIMDVGLGTPAPPIGGGSGSTPVATGLKKHVKINGNLIVNSGTVCDMQTLIFVSGTVTINPDLTSVGNSACVFISAGDITVNTGGNAKTNEPLSSSNLASYDFVYGQLVTDGKLVTTKDQAPGANNKWDGLYFNGGVISKLDPVLYRDINSFANYTQPANIFVYDPRYREVFKDDLSYNKYSLREVGATQ